MLPWLDEKGLEHLLKTETEIIGCLLVLSYSNEASGLCVLTLYHQVLTYFFAIFCHVLVGSL